MTGLLVEVDDVDALLADDCAADWVWALLDVVTTALSATWATAWVEATVVVVACCVPSAAHPPMVPTIAAVAMADFRLADRSWRFDVSLRAIGVAPFKLLVAVCLVRWLYDSKLIFREYEDAMWRLFGSAAHEPGARARRSCSDLGGKAPKKPATQRAWSAAHGRCNSLGARTESLLLRRYTL